MSRPSGRTVRAPVWRYRDGAARRRADLLAAEEPLEIRLETGGAIVPAAVTMRTPGDDLELAVGFLLAEGVIGAAKDVASVAACADPDLDPAARGNVVTVTLSPGRRPDLDQLARHFRATSACGVCGKTSIAQLEARGLTAPPPGPTLEPDLLARLPDALRAAQRVFDDTGGLHAAGLFDAEGNVLAVREDIGRHNAVDKVIGWALLADHLPLHAQALVVSGRAGFEIVQKALVAGIPLLAAVSAPSSLAVSLARTYDQTLVGFLRPGRMNVYSGRSRIPPDS